MQLSDAQGPALSRFPIWLAIFRERLGELPVRWWLPAALYLAACLLGTLLAPDAGLALNRLRWVLLGVALFLAAALWAHTAPRLRRAAGALLALGLAAALLSLAATDWSAGALVPLPALYAHLPVLLHLPGSGVPNPANGANPRMVAGAMALFLPLALSIALFGRGRRLRVLAGLSIPVLLLPLLLSQSPQGLLALALGVGLLLALLWPKSLALQALLAGAALALWPAVAARLPPPLAERLLERMAVRLNIWPAALLMLRDAAFTGSGLNNFPVIYAQYIVSGATEPHAHNLFLQTAVNGGIPALLALLALLGAALWAALRLRHLEDPGLRALTAGLAGGVAAFVGYGLFDSMTLGNLPALGLWAILGLLAGADVSFSPPFISAWERKGGWGGWRGPFLSHLGRKGGWGGWRGPLISHLGRKGGRGGWRGLLLAVLALLALLGTPLWGSELLVNAGRLLSYGPRLAPPPDSTLSLDWQTRLGSAAAWLWPANSRAYALQARAAHARRDFTAGLAALQRAAQLDPAAKDVQLQLADDYQRLGMLQDAGEHYRLAGVGDLLLRRSSTARGARDYAAAAQWAQLAAAAEPGRAQPWLVLGADRQSLDDLEGARQAYQQAGALDPHGPAAYQALGRLLAGPLKDPAGAWGVLAQGLANVPPAKSAGLHYQRSQLAAQAGDASTAETEARQAVRLAPATYSYWQWLGDLMARQARAAEAQVYYRQALAKCPDPAQRAAIAKKIEAVGQ